MKIPHACRQRVNVRGVTPRRLAAASGALRRERERLALFVDQVAAEQGTAEDRIQRFDDQLIEPEQVIEPYDQWLQDLDADTRRWRARQIQLHFRSRWIEFCRFEKGPAGFMVAVDCLRVVLLASRDYLFGFHEWRERHPHDSFEFETPLAGLAIGQQLAWLRKRVREDSQQLLLFPRDNNA